MPVKWESFTTQNLALLEIASIVDHCSFGNRIQTWYVKKSRWTELTAGLTVHQASAPQSNRGS